MSKQRVIWLVLALWLCVCLEQQAFGHAHVFQDPLTERGLEPPTITEIEIQGAPGREEAILRAISLQVGEPFSWKKYQDDTEFLWKRLRVRLERAVGVAVSNTEVKVILVVEAVEALHRLVFVGNEEFERERLLLESQFAEGQLIDQEAVPQIVGNLEAFYEREGFAFVEITPDFDMPRSQLTLRIDEGPLVRVGDVDFIGNDEFPSWTFLGLGLDLSGEIDSGDGFLIFPGSKFSEEAIRLDLVALEKLYHEYGYLEAEARLESATFYRDDNSRVELLYHIYEGPRYTVRSIKIRSAEDGTELLYPLEELEELIQIEPGSPYSMDRILADGDAIRRYYGEKGHPNARNTQARNNSFFVFNPPRGVPETIFDTETHEVDVTYVILEGRPMRVRDVLIEGNVHTEDSVIRRNISLEPGQLANSDEAFRSQRRLLGLNYFADPTTSAPYVDWRFLEIDGEDDWVNLRYEVAEGQTGRLLFGGGVNTAFGPFIQVSIQKDNFNIADPPSSFGDAFSEILEGRAFTGAGQTLRISAAPGTEFSQYSIGFTEPDLFNDHIDRWSLNTNFFKTFFFLETHEEERTGANFTIGRNFGRFFTVFATPGLQNVGVDDLRARAPNILRETRGFNRLQDLTFGINYNTVEDPFSPIDGGSIRLAYTQAGEWVGGDWDFNKIEMRVAKYFPLWQDGLGRYWVLATSGSIRKARETGDLSGVPYTERYFLGGQNTLRGFDFRGVGPRARGFPLGGEAAWNGTLEFRFPLVSTRQRNAISEVEYVRGGVFMDFGSVGQDLSALGPTRISAGFGVRIRLPFIAGIALQLDFGWPVQDEPRDDARVFSFTFGSF